MNGEWRAQEEQNGTVFLISPSGQSGIGGLDAQAASVVKEALDQQAAEIERLRTEVKRLQGFLTAFGDKIYQSEVSDDHGRPRTHQSARTGELPAPQGGTPAPVTLGQGSLTNTEDTPCPWQDEKGG